MVGVGFSVASGGDAAAGFEPGVGAFDRPALAAFGIACPELAFLAAPDLTGGCAWRDRLAVAPAFADPWLDAAGEQFLFELA